MCLESLSYAEEWYFEHDPIYHKTVQVELKRLGLPLRLPSLFDEIRGEMNAFVMSMGRSRGYMPGQVKRRWRARPE